MTRTRAWPYLLPGILSALVFVIFPMLYTMGMGFTNYSARNLLDYERARALLLEEKLTVEGSERAFSLHPEGEQLRLHLQGDGSSAALVSPLLSLDNPASAASQPIHLTTHNGPLAAALPVRDVVPHLPALRTLELTDDAGHHLTLANLRSFAQTRPLYQSQADGSLRDNLSGEVYRPDPAEGFFTSPTGETLQPGYQVNVGLRHFARIFTDERFRAPFFSVFGWTVIFSACTVLFTTALGLLLAVLMNWEGLEGRSAYRLVLFLPYAVPGFISILVFKGLFNQNLGEVNLILNGLFGIKPAWFSDPLLAKVMLLIVNTWWAFRT
jgi:maltose/maltodextrin transport system permease protein